MDFPFSVRSYSTFGGIWLYSLRLMRPSASSSFEGVCQGAEGGGFEAAFEFVVACGAVHHEAVDDAQFVFSLDEGHGVVESGVRDAAFEFFVRKFQVHLHRPFFPMMVLRVSGAGKYYISLHTLY